MLLSLAWKNIWRNKKRSVVVLMAIASGMWGGLFSGAFMMGMGESMVNSAIDRNMGHFQIHDPQYMDDPLLKHSLNKPFAILDSLAGDDRIKAATARTVLEGMASSPANAYGVQIFGVDAEAESLATQLTAYIREGGFFKEQKRNALVMGAKLAGRLNLRLRSKVVLSFQGTDGEIVYLAGRIVGLFHTESTMFDETSVFIKRDDLTRVLGLSEPAIHEIAVRLHSARDVEEMVPAWQARLEHLSVKSWKELEPGLAFMATSVKAFTYLFVAIILFALLFGITNNMLMSVMERIRELGILSAIGMSKLRLFGLILVETILLAISGGIIGMTLGSLTIVWFNTYGLPLTAFAAGMESFGIASTLYPYLPANMYAGVGVMIFVAALISSLMPAWKATHLRPAEAIRMY